MDLKDPLIGREFKDYRVTEKLGGGAFGAVYRAEHTRLSKSFAVKVLHPHIATNADIVKRFRREAQSLAGLDHPNIVQIIDFDQDEEIGFYLVLEWLKGDPLNQVLKKEGVLPAEQVIDLFTQLLGALGEAHAQGIVHRDLKPANLMILPSGHGQVLKILDFGIAAIADSNHELTTDGTAMGSANYMSPEQALGKIREIDPRSDLYSCGIILGKCLTGKNVYSADSPTQILWKHIYEPAPRLNDLYPEGLFPEILENIFSRSIAKDKADRFQSANEFSLALREALLEMRQGMSGVMAPSLTPRITPTPFVDTGNGASVAPAVTPVIGMPPTSSAVSSAVAASVGAVSSAMSSSPAPVAATGGAVGRAFAASPSRSSIPASSVGATGGGAVVSAFASTPAPSTLHTPGAGVESHVPSHAVGATTPQANPNAGREPGYSSVSLGTERAESKFSRFTPATSSSPQQRDHVGESSASSSGASTPGGFSPRTLGQPATGRATVHDTKNMGESSASMSSSFGPQASNSSTARPMIRGVRGASNRNIRSARLDDSGTSSGEFWEKYRWVVIGLATLIVVALVWFFVFSSKRDDTPTVEPRRKPPTERKTGTDDSFWKSLEREANKKRQ